MNRTLLLACLLLGACTASSTQTLDGRVDRTGFSGTVLGVRAVAGDRVVATTPVAADGTFSLDLPAGTGYRLEIITSTGAQPLVGQGSGVVRTFDICQPQDPYDLGDIYQGDAWPGDPGCDPSTDGNCCLDADGNGTCDDGPPACDPTIDPMCGCTDPNPDGTCSGGGGTPGCDPNTDPTCCVDADNDGNCDPGPPPCDPSTDPLCGCMSPNADGTCGDPPPCADPTDPNCCVDADGDGLCDGEPPPCDPNADGSCCDPSTGMNCGDPGCVDADGDGLCDGGGTDPGCMPDSSGNCAGCAYDDPTMCWPPPDGEPCDSNGVCDPGDCGVPQHDIPDFGCDGG